MNDDNILIDAGRKFDFGKTSEDYAKYRDIYPEEFYRNIIDRGLCVKGQNVLDIGTGTGVLPRNMYRYGAQWTGTDASKNQIEMAKKLSQGMNIEYYVSSAEDLRPECGPFDVITACQCFWYFDHEKTAPALHRLLKRNGMFVILCMEWLPFEDRIAGASEELVLRYSPNWTGAGEVVHPVRVPECYLKYFEPVWHREYRLRVPFTRESWNGRMRSCRGIGASLSEREIRDWEAEHRRLLNGIAPETFDVLHYAAVAELRKR